MFSLTRLQAYGIAVVGVILAAAVRKAINPMLGEDLPLFVFILPIVVAGWFGGLWPGLLSTLLSCIIGHRFFIHHVNQLNLTREFALAFTGTCFSILFEKTREAMQAHLKCLERFRLLVENTKDHALFTLDRDGRIICWNAGAERVEGYRAGEVVGRHHSMFYEPEDVKSGKPALDLETAAAEGHFEEEGWRTRKDGSRFWASGIITPLHDDRGRIVGFAKLTRDITARRLAHDRTRFLADLNEALMPLAEPEEILNVAMRMLGEFLDVDRCGYAEVMADQDQFVVRGNYTRGVSSIVGQYRMSEFGENEQQVLRGTDTYVINDVELEAPPGADLDLYRRGQIRAMVCVPLSKNGHFVARMSVQQSTPRYWSKEEIQLLMIVANRCWESVERANVVRNLKESEERFAKAFRTSPDPLVISRIADGVILEVNDTFVSLSGYDRTELLGKSPAGLGLYADPADRAQAVTMMREKGYVRDFEFRMRRRSGEIRIVQLSAEPMELRGEHCWLTIGRDITESKRAEQEREQLLVKEKAAHEQAEAANRTKDEFLATISHELRTPLTSILGWARILSTDSLSESQTRHALQVIEQSAKAQSRLVDDILDTSRIISGRLKLEARPVEIEEVFRAAIDVIRPTAEAKHVTLKAIGDGGGTIQGDANRLQQVIWNLLSNAVKFTHEGGTVEVRLARLQKQIEISVTDTGIGIEPEFLPHVFDRFRQADSTSTRRYGGLGLGLAIVRHVVELHGGTVVASSPGRGRGATFIVKLPVAAGAALTKPQPRVEKTNVPKSRRLTGVRILIVEDDRDTLEMLRFALSESGAVVDVAASMPQSLEKLERFNPDVLISDLAMPDHDGYELISQVRSGRVDRAKHIPAVALSSYTRSEDRMHALAAGFQVHISKPVDLDQLIAVISRLTSSSRRRS